MVNMAEGVTAAAAALHGGEAEAEAGLLWEALLCACSPGTGACECYRVFMGGRVRGKKR